MYFLRKCLIEKELGVNQAVHTIAFHWFELVDEHEAANLEVVAAMELHCIQIKLMDLECVRSWSAQYSYRFFGSYSSFHLQ